MALKRKLSTRSDRRLRNEILDSLIENIDVIYARLVSGVDKRSGYICSGFANTIQFKCADCSRAFGIESAFCILKQVKPYHLYSESEDTINMTMYLQLTKAELEGMRQ